MTDTLDPFAYLALVLSGSLEHLYYLIGSVFVPFCLPILSSILALHNSRCGAKYIARWQLSLWRLQSFCPLARTFCAWSPVVVSSLMCRWRPGETDNDERLGWRLTRQISCLFTRPSMTWKTAQFLTISYSIRISRILFVSFSNLLQMRKYPPSFWSFLDAPLQVPIKLGLATTPPRSNPSLLVEARLAERTTPVHRAYMHVP